MQRLIWLVFGIFSAVLFASDWKSMSGKERFNALDDMAKRLPLNFGEGNGGIDYGGERPKVEGHEKDDEKPPEKKPASSDATPSSGNCLGVCKYRQEIQSQVFAKDPKIKVPTKADIKKFQEKAADEEFAKVKKWMAKANVKDYDDALYANRATMKQLLDYAQNNPGGWIGLKSRTVHHAVQVYNLNGALMIVDPNLGVPMYGDYNRSGQFEWRSTQGKLGAVVDFAYLPADEWKP